MGELLLFRKEIMMKKDRERERERDKEKSGLGNGVSTFLIHSKHKAPRVSHSVFPDDGLKKTYFWKLLTRPTEHGAAPELILWPVFLAQPKH
jgi:hypothetical protein